jgi:molecular chaperone Hsp33
MSPFIGEGVLSITKRLESAKQPYTGRVNLEYGNIAQDLAHYFLRSEQTPTAFNLSMQFDEEGRVVGAGGLMVQGYPGVEDEDAGALDSVIRSLPSIGTMLSDGATPHGIAEHELSEFDPIALGRRPVQFYCPCSKDRFSRYLAALPIEEIRDIRDNGPFPLKTTCHNCNSTYEFSPEELDELYQMAR